MAADGVVDPIMKNDSADAGAPSAQERAWRRIYWTVLLYTLAIFLLLYLFSHAFTPAS